MGKELKDMSIYEKLHWLAFPSHYNNSDDYKSKEMVYIDILNYIKSLEIIKDKKVDIPWLKKSENYSKYNLGVGSNQALKKTEYMLLKEIL